VHGGAGNKVLKACDMIRKHVSQFNYRFDHLILLIRLQRQFFWYRPSTVVIACPEASRVLSSSEMLFQRMYSPPKRLVNNIQSTRKLLVFSLDICDRIFILASVSSSLETSVGADNRRWVVRDAN
jgi:hypothetical protein